jgi:hypothetical protein
MTLEELEQLLAAATPGPWEYQNRRVYCGESERLVLTANALPRNHGSADLQLIAAAVNALPAFVRLARAAQRMCEAQLCGLDILASSHYDDMIEVLEGIEEVKP